MKEKKSFGFGTASLIIGIIGLVGFIMPYVAIWLSILAIVLSDQQRRRTQTGLGTAGLILGIVGVISNIIWLGVVALLFATFG